MTNKPYAGKILWVNLSTGNIHEESIPDEVYRQYLSGLGLAAYILYPRIPAGADPLGAENILGFVSGLLTGTGSLFTGRWMVAGKSPLTGTWGDANCGGTFSPAIKRCGYDGIFFTGLSQKPVILVVDANGARLEDAANLWGMDSVETEITLTRQFHSGKKPSVACIGPAGEKRSLLAGVCHDRGRLAARSGLGAVMGAKMLKAVVLNGSQPIRCADPEKVKALSRACSKYFRAELPLPQGKRLPVMGKIMRALPLSLRMDGMLSIPLFRKWGTTGMNQVSVEWGDSPIKNWAGSEKDYPQSRSNGIDPDKIIAREIRKYHCYSCPLGCGGICSLGEGETHKPEYETVMAFGGLLLNDNLDAIFEINDRLNRAGMDTISAGAAVGFALEAAAQGALTREQLGGLDLSWGNAASVIGLVDQMIQRQGIGDLLADGVKRAAARLNSNSSEGAIHAGGQEIAMHDPRLDPGYALHASVEPTPGRHTTGAQTYYEMYRLWKRVKSAPRPHILYGKDGKYRSDPEKAAAAVCTSCFTQLYNGAGLCMFGGFLGVDRLPFFEWLNAATGWQISPDEYMQIGRRIQTLRQMFNIKQGVDPRKLSISPRAIGMPPLKQGANRGRSIELEAMKRDYWQQMGWDPQTGIPTTHTLHELGLNGTGDPTDGLLD